MKKNIIFLILNLSFLILNCSLLIGIEVGGHISEDTTWSPENNPYLVTQDVFVDNNVTLTILPGTEIKINAAPYDRPNSLDENFVFYNHTNIGKLIWVDGRLIAEGTQENPIIFTRIQDSLYYHWGVIYLTENAGLCRFKYCNFSYSAAMIIVLGIIPHGAISIYNQENIVEHCNFFDTLAGVAAGGYPLSHLYVTDCNFYNIEGFNPNFSVSYLHGGIVLDSYEINNPILLANNKFMENISSYSIRDFGVSLYSAYNKFEHSGILLDTNTQMLPSYIFKNEILNYKQFGIDIDNQVDTASVYIKKNTIKRLNSEGSQEGIKIGYAYNGYVEISDNYLEGCGVDIGVQSIGKVYNNIVNDGTMWIPADIMVNSNIVYNSNNYVYSSL